jgi:outer membrane protein assembly factor BamB
MATEIRVDELVFVGFNSRIAAMDANSGEIIWQWRSPRPSTGGYVTLLLLDENRLVASVNGYTYCLDPASGTQLWYNELVGFGTGATSIAALGRQTSPEVILAAAEAAARAASHSAAASG